MGKLNLGILGGFSGTVGTVVGSTSKKGDDIIRAKSKYMFLPHIMPWREFIFKLPKLATPKRRLI